MLDFVDSGHDLILAAGASASDLVRSIARQCGVDFDEVRCIVHNLVSLDEWKVETNVIDEYGFDLVQDPSTVVIDHTNYAVLGTQGDHTLIASDDFIQSDVILGKNKIEVGLSFINIFSY